MGILLPIQGDVDRRTTGRYSIPERRLDLHIARRIDYGPQYEIRVKVLASVNKAIRR